LASRYKKREKKELDEEIRSLIIVFTFFFFILAA
jgi:hypothetical protein